MKSVSFLSERSEAWNKTCVKVLLHTKTIAPNGANPRDMKQKRLRRNDGFYSASAILFGICFLSIALAIAARMEYLEVAKLNARFASGQLFSQHLISYANLLLIGSTFLYVSHLWITPKFVGQLASGMATIGAMGITVALLLRWLEINYMHQSGQVAFSNLFDVTALFSAVTVVIYLAMEKVYRTRAAGAFVMPIVMSAVLFESLWLSGDQGTPGNLALGLKSYWIHAHILTIFIGYGAFAIATLLGIIYLFMERVEKRGMARGFAIRSLPVLQRIDRLMFEAIALGLSTYTLGTILGMTWSYQLLGSFWSWTQKEVSAFVVWLIYLVYFYGCYRHQWRGHRKAWQAIISFGVSLLCLIGMNFLLTGRHT